MSPINKELHKGTKPAPGVIATKPATKPVEPPTKERKVYHLNIFQVAAMRT